MSLLVHAGRYRQWNYVVIAAAPCLELHYPNSNRGAEPPHGMSSPRIPDETGQDGRRNRTRRDRPRH